jgi:rhodanese-related sulfurtransferase
VRSKEAFDKDHIKNSISIPIKNLDSFFFDSSLRLGSVNDGKKLLVYSERGEVSVEAARLLAKRGFEVLNLEGGVVFWIRAGYEVER